MNYEEAAPLIRLMAIDCSVKVLNNLFILVLQIYFIKFENYLQRISKIKITVPNCGIIYYSPTVILLITVFFSFHILRIVLVFNES